MFVAREGSADRSFCSGGLCSPQLPPSVLKKARHVMNMLAVQEASADHLMAFFKKKTLPGRSLLD